MSVELVVIPAVGAIVGAFIGWRWARREAIKAAKRRHPSGRDL